MPALAVRKRPAMSAEKRTRSQARDADSTDQTSDLSGFTEAIGGGLDPTGATLDPLLGAKMNDVTIVRVLAEGGMGRVYEGLQDKPRRTVAVKTIRSGCATAEAIRRFERESEVLGRLSHPHIGHVYAAGIHKLPSGALPHFVMEYIADALPLTAYARERGLSRLAILELFGHVCDAVAYGHKQEPAVVHRDLKPSNILVDQSGNPKVIDFGIAKCMEATPESRAERTSTGQIVGSVPYMSPEQFTGDPAAIGPPADVYALGVILYELLAGKPPYEVRGLNVVEASQIVLGPRPAWPPEVAADIGPDLLAIVDTCLSKDAAARFADAGELHDAIRAAIAGQPMSLPGSDAQASLSTHRPRSERAARRTALLMAAAAVVAAIRWFWPQPTPPEESTYPFTFNGRRYEIIFTAVNRDAAVKQATARKGSLARIDTPAHARAVVDAVTEAGCGPIHLWAYRRPGSTLQVRSAGGVSAFTVIPPVCSWTEMDGRSIIGGFLLESPK
jgi:serine/threonine protein kinase